VWAAHGLHAVGPALGLQFGVQYGGVGDALVPPLADPRLERVEPGLAASGLDQQLVHVGFAGEPGHGAAVQAEGAADGAQRVADVQQLPDGGVPPPLSWPHCSPTVGPVEGYYGQAVLPVTRRIRPEGTLVCRPERASLGTAARRRERLCPLSRRSHGNTVARHHIRRHGVPALTCVR